MPQDATARWSEDSETILRRLWGEGSTAAEIAMVMHVSRSAVTGKLWRMNLLGGRAHKPQAPAKNSPRGNPPRATAPKMNAAAPPMQPAAMPMQPVPLLQAEEHHCRAIVVDRGPDGLAMYCGKPKHGGSSFCRAHYSHFHTHGTAGGRP